MRARLLPLLVALFAACGGSGQEAESPDIIVEAEPEPEAARPVEAVSRAAVDAALEEGLGRFLQHVEVAPVMEGEAFRGFRVVALRPPEFWAGVDLMAGDVVQSLNDMPIGRDTEAHAAFIALRTASAIRVKLVRAGEPRELVIRIEGPPSADAAPAPSGSAAPAPAPAGSARP